MRTEPIFIVIEKTSDGYKAYANDFETYPVVANGATELEIRENVVTALNVVLAARGEDLCTIGEIMLIG